MRPSSEASKAAGVVGTREGHGRQMQDYRVELEAYSGPLDLLLHLVRRHEIDLNNIPIAKLTEQYMAHLQLMERLDVELAGEFLVMAATLLEIKSKMLLPRLDASSAEEGAGDGGALDQLDPRYELVQQLLAYKRFKDAAIALEEQQEEWSKRYARRGSVEAMLGQQTAESDSDEEAGAPPLDLDLEDVSVLDLCEAFARILETIGQGSVQHRVVYDDTPIALHVEDLLDRLKRDGPMTLQDVFVGRAHRSEMIGLFLATLELVRQRRLRVWQEEAGGTIKLELREDQSEPEPEPESDLPHDWRNPQTGEVEYEWPDEESRQRAQHRHDFRAKWAQKRQNTTSPPNEHEEPFEAKSGDDPQIL